MPLTTSAGGRGSTIAQEWYRLDDAVEGGLDGLDIETVELTEYEDVASRVGLATLTAADGSTIDRVKFIEQWVPEDGEWRIHYDIWNTTLADDA